MNENQLKTVEAYNRSAQQYNNTIAQLKNYDHTYLYLLDLLKPEQTILDLACGPANISSFLINRKNLNVIGIDLSEEMISLARNTVPSGKFIQTSIIDFTLDEKVDAVINGFGFPYLTTKQIEQSLTSSYNVLNNSGLIYLSFMHGSQSRFEVPSFNRETEIYIYYHEKDAVINVMKAIGFEILKHWELDYPESDGSITKDIILIGKK